MRTKKPVTKLVILCLCVASPLALWACTDSATEAVPQPPTAEAGVDSAPEATSLEAAPPIDAGPKLITYTGTVHTFDSSKELANQPVLEGAEVCAASLQPAPCVKTNVMGRWVMRLPANDRSLRLTYTAPNHLSVQHVVFTTEEDDTNDRTILAPDTTAKNFWTSCGATYPDTNGAVLLQGYRRTGPNTFIPLDGATMAAASGVGPCYMAKVFEHDAQQTTTKAAGVGVGVIANVPAGSTTLDVTVSLAGTVCYSHGHLIDGPTANVIRVPVRPGFVTAADVVCE